jgi:hypothetical protein
MEEMKYSNSKTPAERYFVTKEAIYNPSCYVRGQVTRGEKEPWKREWGKDGNSIVCEQLWIIFMPSPDEWMSFPTA